MFMIEIDTSSHYALLGVSPTATAAEIRKVRDDTVLALRAQIQQASTPERKKELNERQQAVNAAGEVLVRPDQREEYDRAHPELRPLARRPATAALFIDPTARVDLIFRSLNDHLARVGARPRPPSDLYRANFAQDLTPNPLLDRILADRRR
jgi:curved DNA-binding protein CbpA